MMKAVVKAKAEPGLWLEQVRVPKVGGDDVLIRVLKASKWLPTPSNFPR